MDIYYAYYEECYQILWYVCIYIYIQINIHYNDIIYSKYCKYYVALMRLWWKYNVIFTVSIIIFALYSSQYLLDIRNISIIIFGKYTALYVVDVIPYIYNTSTISFDMLETWHLPYIMHNVYVGSNMLLTVDTSQHVLFIQL